ncbi:MAG: hypothetical protein AAFO74_16205 [Pseudomonadota bacterium]
MKLSVLKEVAAGDARVAVTPETVKKYVGLGHDVTVQSDAGLAAGYTDEAYTEAGAKTLKTPASVVKGADVLLCVRTPDAAKLPEGLTVIGLLDPFKFDAAAFNGKKLTAHPCSGPA